MSKEVNAQSVFESFIALDTEEREQAVGKILKTYAYLTDTHVCTLLNISTDTLRRNLKDGPPPTMVGKSIDLRDVSHIYVGGQRRWNSTQLQQLIIGE